MMFSLLDDRDTIPVHQDAALGLALIGVMEPQATKHQEPNEKHFGKGKFHDQFLFEYG